MTYTRRQIAILGGLLFVSAVAVLFTLFFIYLPLIPGANAGLVSGIMIPTTIVAGVGMWLLTWVGLYWRDRKSPSSGSS